MDISGWAIVILGISLLGAGLSSATWPDGEAVPFSKLPRGAYQQVAEHEKFVLLIKEGSEKPLHVEKTGAKDVLPEYFTWIDGAIYPIQQPAPEKEKEAQDSE